VMRRIRLRIVFKMASGFEHGDHHMGEAVL
jgi:hypothetical protein